MKILTPEYCEVLNEAATDDQLAALTKVLLSTKHSYGVINAVRSKLDTPAGDVLLGIVSVIAGNTSLFNAFVTEFKKGIGVTEEVEIEETLDEATKTTNGVKWKLASESDRRRGEYYVVYDKTTKKMVAFGLTRTGAKEIAATDKNLGDASADFFADNIMYKTVSEDAMLTEDEMTKLKNDIGSLKRIGWSLDKVHKFIITKDYGTKVTGDVIANIYSPPKEPKVKAPKVKVAKKPKWPNDPPKNKVNDTSHALAYLNQAVASEESPDITGGEAWTMLTQAGYTEKAALWVIKMMGWEGDLTHGQGGTPQAKKSAPPWKKK